MSEDLSGVVMAAQELVARAEATAEPICSDRTLSTEGRVEKVAEADAATKAEFAQLEERVRTARTAAEEAARGAVVEGVDSASVSTAAQTLARLRADGASPDRILERAVAAGDRAMISALRGEQAYHAVHLSDRDRAAVDSWGGTAGFLAKLSEAEEPFLSDEARAARAALAEADRVGGAMEGQRMLLEALTRRHVQTRPGVDGEPEEHLVSNRSQVNQAMIAAAYAGAE